MIENSNRALTGVVIDPGNGGDDIGATGNGLKEKDFNLEVSKYMFDRLNELGVPTTITRTTDVDLDANTRIEKALQAYGNSDDVIIISNHLNAGGSVRKIVMTKKYLVYNFISSLNYIFLITLVT